MASDYANRLGGARSSLAVKAPCRVATTANITLYGEQTIDGVAVEEGDRVLVKDQTRGEENGIYVVDELGWERARDSDGTDDLTAGVRVYVYSGTDGVGEYALTTTGTIIVGSTTLTFDLILGSISEWDVITSSGRLIWTLPSSSDPDFLYSDFTGLGSQHSSVVIGPGTTSGASLFSRVTVVGAHALQSPDSANRVEAFGQGALRWARFPERTTAIGSLVMQWLGCQTSKLVERHHDFWDPDVNGSDQPGDAGWDWNGLETRNPGIGAKIAAVTEAANSDEIEGNVGVGRDALVELIKGTYNTSVGYKSMQSLYYGRFMTATGYGAGRDAVLSNHCAYYGYYAGRQHQEGDYNAYFGSRAGEDMVTGENNTMIGAKAGSDGWTGVDAVVLLGYAAGLGITPSSNFFAVHNGELQSGEPLLNGNLSTLRLRKGWTSDLTTATVVPAWSMHGTSASQASQSVTRWAASAAGARTIGGKTRGAAPGSFGRVTDADTIWSLIAAVDDGTAVDGSGNRALVDGAEIRASVDATTSDGVVPTRWGIFTRGAGSATLVERVRADSKGNIGINGSSFGSGEGAVFLANATTLPSTNPTGGGVLFCDAGALKFRGSSGTVTTIANA